MSEHDPRIHDFAEGAKALSRNPLGIFGLFALLTYGIAGLVAIFGTSFTPFQRDLLTLFIVGFPLLILGLFGWLVVKHSGKLFAPSDFRKDENYLQAVQSAAARAENLSKAEPATEGQVQLAIAPAEVKALPTDEEAGVTIEPPTKTDAFPEPKPEWKRFNYEVVYMHLLRTGATENAEAISDAYLNTEQAGQDNNTASWKAYRLAALVRFTNERNLDNFDELKRFAESNPRIAKVQEYLAVGYMHYGDFETAAGILQQAASQTEDIEETARLLCRAAFCAAKARNLSQADQIIEAIKKIRPSESQHQNLINSIREVAETTEDDDTLIALLERVVEDNPSDTDARFSLALKHSAHGERDMALIHYLRIPAQERSSAAWNNLGVEFDHWKLRAKAVDAFKTAEEMGETLAAANLADTLISAGFIEEARNMCDTAMKKEKPHNNVSAALARLEEVSQSEEKALGAITRKARVAVDFYKELAKAIFRPNIDAMPRVWNGPQCEMKVTLEGKRFTAVGSYDVPLGLAAFLPAAASAPPDRVTIQYDGSIKGHSVTGSVSRKHSNTPPPTLLSAAANEPEPFQMLVADSGGELKVMEGRGSNRRFYVWRMKDN